MTDLGLMTFFLGIEIKQGEHEIFICQKNMSRRFRRSSNKECKEMNTPMNQKEKLCRKMEPIK